MVDPQWDIWYWGSRWNLHTVCWSAVGCEWGTTSVYFGITYVCFIPSRLPVFAVEPQYLLQNFLILSKVSFEGHIQNLQKISCWIKIWMRFVGPILIKLWRSCIWGFPYLPLRWTLGDCLCKHAGHHSVTIGACSQPHLTCLGLCSMAAWKLNGPICAMHTLLKWRYEYCVTKYTEICPRVCNWLYATTGWLMAWFRIMDQTMRCTNVGIADRGILHHMISDNKNCVCSGGRLALSARRVDTWPGKNP